MGSGICGAGMLRVANSLLKTLGRESVSLVLPATAMAVDAAGQLGLVDPGVQEVVISGVVVRELNTGNLGPRRRVEFTLSAAAVTDQLPSLGMGSGEDLFRAVLGLKYAGQLFHVERVVPESFAGTLCFYVVTAVE